MTGTDFLFQRTGRRHREREGRGRVPRLLEPAVKMAFRLGVEEGETEEVEEEEEEGAAARRTTTTTDAEEEEAGEEGVSSRIRQPNRRHNISRLKQTLGKPQVACRLRHPCPPSVLRKRTLGVSPCRIRWEEVEEEVVELKVSISITSSSSSRAWFRFVRLMIFLPGRILGMRTSARLHHLLLPLPPLQRASPSSPALLCQVGRTVRERREGRREGRRPSSGEEERFTLQRRGGRLRAVLCLTRSGVRT